MHVVLGTLGVTLLIISGIPQLVRSVKMKNVTGLSPYSLCCVFFGCACMSVYTILEQGFSTFHMNYFVNGMISFTNLVLYFRYKK